MQTKSFNFYFNEYRVFHYQIAKLAGGAEDTENTESNNNAGLKTPHLTALVQRSRQKEQKLQHINGT